MTPSSRRVLAAALATTALSAAAAPSPASAATPARNPNTTLATSIQEIRPVLYETVNPLNARNVYTVLRPQAGRLRKHANELANVPADAAQRTAKNDFVSAMRLEARGNVGIAAGLEAKLKHDSTLYRADVVKGRDTLRLANLLAGAAEVSIGLPVSHPIHFSYCAHNRCPAG